MSAVKALLVSGTVNTPVGHDTSTEAAPGALPEIVTMLAVVMVVCAFNVGAGGGISPVTKGGTVGAASNSPDGSAKALLMLMV